LMTAGVAAPAIISSFLHRPH